MDKVSLRKLSFLLPLALFFIIALNYRLSSWVLPEYSLYDIKRILELLLLVITGCFLILSTTQRRMWLGLYNELPYVARLLITGFFLLSIISSMLAPLPYMALLELSLYLLLFYFILFIASQRLLYGAAVDKTLVGITILGALVYIATFFKVYISSLVFHYPFNIFPGFVNLRFFAHYQVWTLPLITLPLFLLPKHNWIFKIAIYIIAILWWTLAIANGAKGMYVCSIIGCWCFCYICL